MSQKLPDDAIEQWPEVLDDVEVNAIPLEYLHAIYVTFEDGRVWEIQFENQKLNEDTDDIARTIESELEILLTEYEDVIAHVDFRLDTERVKNDIKRRTRTFMKKQK
jgi:vacuolar-type H+-ATPase subunit I/STV1